LQIETQVSAAARQQQIAPLSLQLLVENAIKHNVISRDNPLKIKILQEHNTLTVENNLQTKKTFEKSTKVGLQNIINRYRLLTERPVEVVADDLKFAVKIPLL
jgi:LytS/YehU family sensor histidine kinase